MTDLIVALGLVLVIEGFLYAAFPEQMKAMLVSVQTMPIQTLRMAGVIAFAVGAVVVWIVRA